MSCMSCRHYTRGYCSLRDLDVPKSGKCNDWVHWNTSNEDD